MDNLRDNELDARLAFQTLRGFWVAYNAINMYGTDHPLAEKQALQFQQILSQTLKKVAEVVIHLDGQQILCNGHNPGAELNLSRLAERLLSAEIMSITFQAGVTTEELLEFFRLLIDRRNYQTIESISGRLKEKKVHAIQLNAYAYLKVSADAALVVSGSVQTAAEKSAVIAAQTSVHGSLTDSKAGAITEAEQEADSIARQERLKPEPGSKKGRSALKLPQGIENFKNSRLRLEQEVYRSLRYNQPLSVLLVSFIQENRDFPESLADGFREALPLIRSKLRFVDFIGTLGQLKANRILIILPQTALDGAQVVGERIFKVLKGRFVISVSPFDRERSPDFNSFLKMIRRRHEQVLADYLKKD